MDKDTCTIDPRHVNIIIVLLEELMTRQTEPSPVVDELWTVSPSRSQKL